MLFFSVPDRPLGVVLYVLLLLISRPGLGAPANIATVSLSGNEVLGTREILEWMATNPGLEFSQEVVDHDIRIVSENYRSHGFYSARVDSVSRTYSADSSLVDVVFHITEGPRTVVASYRISGNHIFSTDEILEGFLLRPGDPLDEHLLEEDIGELLRRYERMGYPLARCTITDLRTTSVEMTDSLDIFLEVHEGGPVTIDEIQVEGNTETDADVIVRETRIRMGELFDPDKSQAIQQRLQRLNLFSAVSEPELYLRGEAGGLLIKVQEGNPNTFDGVVGYVPGRDATESGYVTGLVSITMKNLFGTGRKFAFRWQREDRFSQELGVRYLEPWVLGYPVNLSLGFFQRQQDTTYVKRVVDPKGEFMVTEEFSVSLFYTAESVIPQATGASSNVLKTVSHTIGGELVYDTRNDLFSPTSGARFGTDYQYGSRRTSEIPEEFAGRVKSNVVVQKLGLDLDFYLSTFTRQVLAAGFHGRELRSDQLDVGLLYRFGGARTLRGYRENEFLGSRIAWTNLEYRVLLARRSFLFGFIDTGYYFRPRDDLRLIESSEGFRYGYGLGVQVETALGHMSVSYALGQNDTFSNGKIHFGLINEF